MQDQVLPAAARGSLDACCVPACCAQTAPEITAAALDLSDDVACEAVDIFLAIVGAEAGAMALRCLAKGGCERPGVGVGGFRLCAPRRVEWWVVSGGARA